MSHKTTERSPGLALRQLPAYADLRRAIEPSSIAIVGASEKSGAFGERTLAYLASSPARIYPVNARHEVLAGQRCYPSLSALPEVPDCVVLAVPRDAVEPLVAECAALGVGGVIVYASGFAESGPAHAAAQARLSAIAANSRLRIFGPNCLGFVNYANSTFLTFTAFPPKAAEAAHRIGVVSQSGALGVALAQSAQRHVSLSHVLSYGNGCDVDAADLVAYLAQDPACAAIACAFEGSSAPGRLLDAARLALDLGKPLVMYKMAVGQEGARAALSHTGSLAGEDSDFRAAMRCAGVVLVDRFETLLETTVFFAKVGSRRPTGHGVAVIAASGGAGIMAADKAELHRVSLPQPSDAVTEILSRHIPDFGSARNPCDVTAQVVTNPESLQTCAVALACDEAYSALVAPQPVSATSFVSRIAAFEAAAQRSGKPACMVWLTEWPDGPGAAECERSPHVALFRSMDSCFAALAAWQWRWGDFISGKGHVATTDPEARTAAEALLRQAGEDTLTERESKTILALYGVAVSQDIAVHTSGEAAAAAERIGYPVVLKIESPDLPHKSEVGGIRLGLGSATEVAIAYEDMLAGVARLAPTARINGAVVQPMVDAGVEVLVGARHDRHFGPLITVGMGGVMVELLNDVCTATAPVSSLQARHMLLSLKGARLFDGFRAGPAIDLDKLADMVSRISIFARDMGPQMLELDINPVVCNGRQICAVDALIVRSGLMPERISP